MERQIILSTYEPYETRVLYQRSNSNLLWQIKTYMFVLR